MSDGLLKRLPEYENAFELPLVNHIRSEVKRWREEGYPGASRTTLDLLTWRRRDGRERRLFFTQIETAEIVIDGSACGFQARTGDTGRRSARQRASACLVSTDARDRRAVRC